jgi:hypothetical protein
VSEIEEHFDSIKRRRFEESEKVKEKVKAESEKLLEHNSRLRYNEKLNLNRKNATATFKSITRTKRNHMADGKGLRLEQMPHVGQYNSKFRAIES